MRKWAALAVLMLGSPSAAEETPIDYGDIGLEPDDPIAATKKLMLDQLLDPDSARYRFIGIHPATCKAGWATGKGGWTGYAATIDINGKNAMGGYAGFTTYTVLFRDGAAIRAIEGSEFGPYGPKKGPLGLGGGAGVCRWLDH